MKKILVPTDFSAVAANATEFAIRVAKKTGAELVFFHSKETDENHAGARLRKETENLLRKESGVLISFHATNKLFSSLTIEEEFRSGKPDLIVMGTGGESDFQKSLFGTNASDVSENVKCPVLVVPEENKYKKINKIAYASDLYNLEKELPLVAEFAKQFEAEILIFHVAPVFPDLGDTEKRNIRKEIELIADKMHYPHINYYEEKTAHDNQTHKGIESFLEKHRPDLLALFHDEREGIDKLISISETGTTVAHIPLPVLVFKKSS